MAVKVDAPATGWLASRFARLSTGIKMLLILSLGLLPLGLIAILASIDSAHDTRFKRAEETRARLEISAQRINSAIARSGFTIRAASAAVALTPRESAICENTLLRLARAQASLGNYALYAGHNEVRCTTPGFMPPPVPANPGRKPSIIALAPDANALRFALFADNGEIEGAGEFSREALASIAQGPGAGERNNLELVDGNRHMLLRHSYREGGPLVQDVTLTEPIADGQLHLRITSGATPVSAVELLMILLPVMMWIGAAIIGWFIVDRLLLKPLVRMQRAVSSYRPGDRHLDLPMLSTPAREIGDLGNAFDQVTQTVARHEAELEAAVERQTRLVREVHHRVKNNLQVVASLINLHARGAKSEDVAAAYASIQRRVDALSVVHRNHFAELEENRGVALKPLISELGANLRATAPASATGMQIRLDVQPMHATQDAALSVAFLLTEIIEFAMFCGARSVAITLDPVNGGKARLAIEADSLRGDAQCEPHLTAQFERIVTGLSRQLRSALEHDPIAGRYAVEIPILGRDAS